jgi:ATP-dependent DNA helicase RecG
MPGASSFGIASPVEDIDARLTARRVGAKAKGPPAGEVLRDSLGISTVGDLLRHYPRRDHYIDRSATVPMGELRLAQTATVIGRVHRVVSRLTRRRQTMVTVTLYDGTGFVELLFFNQPWIARQYAEGVELAVSGEVRSRRGATSQLASPEIEILRGGDAEQVHTGRITPVDVSLCGQQ